MSYGRLDSEYQPEMTLHHCSQQRPGRDQSETQRAITIQNAGGHSPESVGGREDLLFRMLSQWLPLMSSQWPGNC